ncbi:MAG: hypothetical protein HLUCCA08_01425 [Rhodobacteraceae bacterium HLUCCA08]|nr:MAG: hypothetical protein HLUCCA08_01425 [Rhodobacteraceae bacterium HLUCCA08]
MIRLATLFLAFAAPVSAQSLQQRLQVGQAWEVALAEWSVVLTCSMLDPQSREVAEDSWTRMRDAALDRMQEAGWTEPDLDQLRDRGRIAAMRLPGDPPFSEVVAYCTDNGDWMQGLVRLTVPMLDRDVEAALQ